MQQTEIKNKEYLLNEKKLYEYMKDSLKDFPYDYRYVLLKEDISDTLLNKILKTYTDEEFDMLHETLLNNKLGLSYESEFREEDQIFNLENDIKILSKIKEETKKRFE